MIPVTVLVDSTLSKSNTSSVRVRDLTNPTSTKVFEASGDICDPVGDRAESISLNKTIKMCISLTGGLSPLEVPMKSLKILLMSENILFLASADLTDAPTKN